MVQILTEPKNALVKQYQKLMEYDQVELDFTRDALEAVADRAVERGIGARGLRAVLEEVMNGIMYDVPSDPTIVKVEITGDSIVNHTQPELIRDPERTQRVRGYAGSPEMARAIRTLHPRGLSRNKAVVATLVRRRWFGLLTLLYAVKNRQS